MSLHLGLERILEDCLALGVLHLVTMLGEAGHLLDYADCLILDDAVAPARGMLREGSLLWTLIIIITSILHIFIIVQLALFLDKIFIVRKEILII